MFRGRKSRLRQIVFNTLALAFVGITADSYAAVHWRVTSNFKDQTQFQSAINSLHDANRAIDGLAITLSGDWLMVAAADVWASGTFNSSLRNAVTGYVAAGHRVKGADCSENGACIVIYENWGVHRVGAIPQNLLDKITEYQANGWQVRDVDVTASGYVLLGPGNVASYAGVDSDLNAALHDRHASKRQVQQVEVGFSGEWAVLADQNPMYENVHQTIVDRLIAIGKSNRRIDQFLIGVGGNYVAYSLNTFAPSASAAINSIEFGLGSGGTTNLWTRMEELNVPGASISIIEPGSSHPQVALSRGYGRKKSNEQKPVLATTSFKLASLSKYLGAIAVLDQLEHDPNTALDDDIRTICNSCQLDTWQTTGEGSSGDDYGIPGNDLGAGITLRRLLSHTAGINNNSTRLLQSSWATGSSRTSADWLLGMNCTGSACDPFAGAYTWRTLPIGVYEYSNGGYLIAQTYLEDQDGDTIDDIMQARVFAPIGMPNSSARLNLSSSFLSNTAWQHSATGPQSSLAQSVARPAGGVWSSSADYAEAMIVALNQGRNSAGFQVLNAATAAAMLTDQVSDSGTAYGFGINMDTTVTETNDQDFFHNGSNGDRTYTYMCGNPTRNQGIVVLLNTESDNARQFTSEVITAYRNAVGWPSALTCN